MSQQNSPAAEHKPFVPSESNITETTIRGLVIGSILGIIFAASSVYLGLKTGLTVSASIPIAVISITILRKLGKPTILENNIVQTCGSAGESIAAGVAFTMPSLLLMGFDLEILRLTLVALLGGTLGVLMMIPLRQGLIVKEHGKLAYPEGTACAQVLIVGEKGGTSAATVFTGFGIGALFNAMRKVFHLFAEEGEWVSKSFKGSFSFETDPTLIGVGYIIGFKTSMVMLAGGVLSFLVLIPMVAHFGGDMTSPIVRGGTVPVSEMSTGQIRNGFVLYIGAGAVATGGIITLLRSLPTIFSAFKRGLSNIGGSTASSLRRVDQDLSMRVVLFGSLALVAAIALAPVLNINFASAILIVFFGFFFVTVSSRITGEIGSSSNPISGMTVATLLITCLLFVAVGWTGISFKEMALCTAALVCVAASNGGTISQDLKTGFLVGATPRQQQIAIVIGVWTSALVVGWTLMYLNTSYTTYQATDYPQLVATDARVAAEPKDTLHFADAKQNFKGADYRVLYVRKDTSGVPRGKYLVDDAGKVSYVVDPGVCGTVLDGLGADGEPKKVEKKFDAPKAQLFRLIIDGVLEQELPWSLVLVGVFVALMMELLGVSSLPFAVGVYLPMSTSVSIAVGGIIRKIADKRTGLSEAEAESSPGVLYSSGLIAGGAVAGLVLTALGDVKLGSGKGLLEGLSMANIIPFHEDPGWALLWYVALGAVLFVTAAKKR